MTAISELTPAVRSVVSRKQMTAIEIDLNVRVRGNQTFASFDDADGALAVGESVQVYEPESGIIGEGRITEIDPVKALVYISVDWQSLRDGVDDRRDAAPKPDTFFTPYFAYVGFNCDCDELGKILPGLEAKPFRKTMWESFDLPPWAK